MNHGKPSPRPRSLRTAFTLIELLVVIAVIALLIGILLPALGKARETSRGSKCQTQIRHSLQSTIGFSTERKGQAPVAGQMWGLNQQSFSRDNARFPAAWKDTLTFWHNSDFQLDFPMPFFLSLAEYDGVDWDTSTRENMMNAAGTGPAPFGGAFLSYYRCPSDKTFELSSQDDAGVSLIPGANTGAWWTMPSVVPELTSYVFNESVLGRSPAPGPNAALEGRIDRVLFPSDIFLIMDGQPRLEWNDHLLTIWHDASYAQFNLWDYRQEMITVPPNNASQFDAERHNRSFSVGYVDGHVGSKPLTQAGMQQVIIARSHIPR